MVDHQLSKFSNVAVTIFRYTDCYHGLDTQVYFQSMSLILAFYLFFSFLVTCCAVYDPVAVCSDRIVYFVYRQNLDSVKNIESSSQYYSLNFGSLYLVRFPRTSTCSSDIHYSRSIWCPQFSPTLSSCIQHISACVHQDEQLPYHTTLRGFGFHHICSQCLTPVLSASAYFNQCLLCLCFCLLVQRCSSASTCIVHVWMMVQQCTQRTKFHRK